MDEGVDLYGLYNKVTDWDAVREAGITFAWVKLSDGNTNRDDYGYVTGGRGVGIAMGGYHYAQPGDPVAQADRLTGRCAAEGALELAPALDLEAPFVPGKTAADFAIAFLLRIQELGHVPCLYANQSMLLGVLPAVRKAVPGVKVWGARYGANLTVSHDVHQYTDKGRVPGIAGNVDRNRGTAPLNKEDDMPLTDKEIDAVAARTTDLVVEAMKHRVLATPHDGSAAEWTFDGSNIVDMLKQGVFNGRDAAARDAAILAAVAAVSTDKGITLDAMRQIVTAAVRQHVAITGTVEIGPAAAPA
jgi:GH25 family lysozyme M1 (1,4-beta-N-acetylmuramidase)